ncbi:Reverse transcriptase zinc-binding domain [Arabidopsis thaliana x Arabidopsis arenosa]|uniref:Reverse transcriptase zinc-binding domain n=1 Tax=Arabidopsis thaliana x Arabidopsis arenosa TaxID=1240361 RepID=A0A8T1XP24_9BRAS|nr:Reverse transcriptase zinc-binding domain [Arabidopsis thaliana x Arabidopsis arenosa]
MICGDFNEILDGEEHSSFEDSPLVLTGMREFQDVVRYCSLLDLVYHGPKFTWCNKRGEGLICKKLDRMLVNSKWLQQFPHSYCVFDSGGCSDHSRCRLSMGTEVERGRKPFKFSNVLADLPQFQVLVGDYWRSTVPLFDSTSSLFRLAKKLKGLKPLLRSLGKESLADISQRTKEAHEELCIKQAATLAAPTVQAMEAEQEVYKKWYLLSELEEGFLKQKAKLHWLNVGDQNNKYFHQSAEIRRMQNTIREISTPAGVILTEKEDIKGEAERFFKDFLTFKPEDYQGLSVEQLRRLMDFRCSEMDQNILIQEVSAEEIKKVLFLMPNNKSPGPDGFTSEFFKKSWTIIGKDFIAAIQSFFTKGFLPKGLNSTILALIPKKEIAKEMKDYRPISCCNVIYKVISKIIANRLKELLPKFIATNQSAFVKDRLLMENILLATEVVKDYHKDTISPRCAMKIDISKAFDSVQWDFLLNVLEAMNFPAKFIHWIKLCISTASFSVQVNGELAGFFQSERGLRQGCSLSPYLFVICMNVLSKLLDKAAVERRIGYHPKCKNIQLTHLCFADDLMVFVDGQRRSVEGILKIFDDFARLSGLKISVEKSTLYMAGLSENVQNDILQRFPFAHGHLPVRYLGLPLLTKQMTKADYTPLLERIRTRLTTWTSRNLSYASRLQLLSSVISGIINFWILAYRLPSGCIKELNKLCSAFLWSGPDLNSKKAKIAWSDVCRPKKEGGLGLQSLEIANKTSCLKLIWKIVSGSDSLWVAWVSSILIKLKSFWTIKEDTKQGSWMWRKILKYRDIAKQFHKVEVLNGLTCSFWYDNWSNMGRLYDVTGCRGFIDLGVSSHATVEEAKRIHRRRRYRTEELREIDQLLSSLQLRDGDDTSLWKTMNDKYRRKFSTKATRTLIRSEQPLKDWYKGVWFTHETPKYSFFTWLAINNRLTTGDRIRQWHPGQRTDCILCGAIEETRDHLFFLCSYSTEVWTSLMGKFLGTDFSTAWDHLTNLLTSSNYSQVQLFTIRYALQATLYHVWRERNNRRHGETHVPPARLVLLIDKTIRNRFSSIRNKGDHAYDDGLSQWFEHRPP